MSKFFTVIRQGKPKLIGGYVYEKRHDWNWNSFVRYFITIM